VRLLPLTFQPNLGRIASLTHVAEPSGEIGERHLSRRGELGARTADAPLVSSFYIVVKIYDVEVSGLRLNPPSRRRAPTCLV
jgi:hypothetical protein